MPGRDDDGAPSDNPSSSSSIPLGDNGNGSIDTFAVSGNHSINSVNPKMFDEDTGNPSRSSSITMSDNGNDRVNIVDSNVSDEGTGTSK